MRSMRGWVRVLTVGAWLAAAGAWGQDIKVWELPKGAKPENREGWKPGEAGSSFKNGAALENAKALVFVAPDSAGPVLSAVGRDFAASTEIQVVSEKGDAGKIEKIKLAKKDDAEAVLQLILGAQEVKVRLPVGQPFVEVIPVKGAGSVDVRGKTAYTILPDFFGNDVVFDPKRYKSDKLTAPAENFLLNMLEGGNAIVMCVWQGTLSLGKEVKQEGKEPRVDLFFAGQDKERMVDKSRIEFAGKPVFVALLAAKGIWFERDVSADPAQKAIALDWQRPFEAKWRVDFLNREGAFCKDLMTGPVSWDAWYTSESPGRPDGQGNPTMSMQGLWPYFLIAAWVKDSVKTDNKFYISMYADMNERKGVEGKNNALKAAAKKENKEFVPVYPTNVFERVVVYPVDRRKDTPLTEMTPTDVMRESLGQGPCAYVLDLEGVKAMPSGGSRDTLATCGNYDQYISKFVGITKGGDGWVSVDGKNKKIPGVKAGEKLAPEDEAFLVAKLEDLVLFVTAVNKRLHQYRKFDDEIMALCKEASQTNAQAKPVADKITQQAKMLGQRCSEQTLKNMTKQRDDWDAKIKAIVEEVKSGVYTNIHRSGGIRDYAEGQDIMVSFCRRAVKAIRQEASQADSSDPEVLKFANRVRNMCHDVLRNKHGMEGW